LPKLCITQGDEERSFRFLDLLLRFSKGSFGQFAAIGIAEKLDEN
jgi:hypothetical protein